MGKPALQANLTLLLFLFCFKLFYYSGVVFTNVFFTCTVSEAPIFSPKCNYLSDIKKKIVK